jgi:hypothetical protein
VLYRWGKRSTCSPQHNRNQAVAEMIQKKIYPWAEVRQLPMVFLHQDGEGSFLLPAKARQIELAPA